MHEIHTQNKHSTLAVTNLNTSIYVGDLESICLTVFWIKPMQSLYEKKKTFEIQNKLELRWNIPGGRFRNEGRPLGDQHNFI